ncbi:MAG: Crp/Fnr family transcriptional regulator [Clostridiales bacterium]|nr:Crp/Fnr family transcriptional regulator [Clostridiales bacterium]MDY3745537.1 Crp/Fnr family transcriptional regulator [Lachnospiraceae bacterium]
MLTAEALKKVPLCSSMPMDELKKLGVVLSEYSFIKTMEPNERLMEIGKRTEYLYLLESGMIRTVNYSSAGEEIFFYYFQERTFIGVVNIICRVKNYSDYITMKKSRLYCIPVENFYKALDEIPSFTKAVLEEVSKKSLDLVQLVVVSRRKKTRDRICSYLYLNYMKTGEKMYSTPLTIEMLAKTLNLTRSALSKELHQMEDEGLITVLKNKIQIINPEKLEDSLFF